VDSFNKPTPSPASQPMQCGKRALGKEEERKAVATTKEKQQAPQLIKNVPGPSFPGVLSTVKRGTNVLSNLSEISAVSVVATLGVIIINHAENLIEIA
jgi:hypothetical protein